MQSKVYNDLGEQTIEAAEAMIREFAPGSYMPTVTKDFAGKYRASYIWVCECHDVFQMCIMDVEYTTIDEAYANAEWHVKKHTGNLEAHKNRMN